jgi:hypothetical protein
MQSDGQLLQFSPDSQVPLELQTGVSQLSVSSLQLIPAHGSVPATQEPPALQVSVPLQKLPSSHCAFDVHCGGEGVPMK